MNLTSNIMRWWKTGSEQATITAPGNPKGDPFVVRVEERYHSGGGVILANVLIFAANADDAKARVEASAILMIEEIEASTAARAANLRSIMIKAPPETIEACVARECYNGEKHVESLRRLVSAIHGETPYSGRDARCLVEPLDRAGAYKVEWSTHMMGG